MKKTTMLRWLLPAVLAGAALTVSCVKEQVQDPSDALMAGMPVLTATTSAGSPATKASLDASGQEKLVVWDKGDAISVFYHNTTALKYALEGEGGSPKGNFLYASGFAPAFQFPEIYAAYPYDKATKFNGAAFTLKFPAEQNYTEGGFDPKANLMVAATSGEELYFRNVGGYLVIPMYGEEVSVEKVEVTGCDGEPLAGLAEVYAYEDDTPDTWLEGETSETVTLTADPAVAVGASADAATEFWFVLPPTDFYEGLTVKVTDTEGNVYEATADVYVGVERNAVFRLAPLCVKRVASPFEAEIRWAYAEDAATDHSIFYEGEGGVYSRKALPLGVDAATVSKYGEEIDGAEPESVTVLLVDQETGEAEPAEDVTISNIALKDGELVADVEGFAWDERYQVTFQYALSTCDLTLEGSLVAVDRNRECIVLETVNSYTFTLGEYDDETGYGYSGDPQGTGAGYYLWDGNKLDGEIFAAFQSAGLVTEEDCPDLESFANAELGDNVYPAAPAAIPDGVEAYIGMNLSDMSPFTKESFTEAVLTGDIFSSGAPSADNPLVTEGNTVYLCFTTYLGQEVQIPFVFHYEAADVELPILYSEDFEDNFVQERMPDWLFFDADGDGYDWTFAPYSLANENSEHNQGRNESEGYLASASYINYIGELSPDNWAVTPAIRLDPTANYLSFWVKPLDVNYRGDYVEVYVTTSDQPSSNPEDYTCVYGNSLPGTAYTQVLIKLDDSFNGKTVHVAFRHLNSYDQYWYMIDDIMVTNYDPTFEPEPEPGVIFSASFDDYDFDGWMISDEDGDGKCWGYTEDIFHGDSDSGVSLYSKSYDDDELDPDNWLISPAIDLGSESYLLRFWARSYSDDWHDHYGVYIVECPEDDVLDLSSLAAAGPLFSESAPVDWHQDVVPIPAELKGKTICLLFRHYDSADNWALFLDDIEVVVDAGSSPSPAPARGNDAVRKKVAPKRAAPGMNKKAIPALKGTPLPAWKK